MYELAFLIGGAFIGVFISLIAFAVINAAREGRETKGVEILPEAIGSDIRFGEW